MKDHVVRLPAPDARTFREWLEENHASAEAVWLVYRKKASGRSSITWSEAVDEALCYGWIDSKMQTIDEESYEQYFTRRKPTSPWSKINKDKVAALEAAGMIRPSGAAAIAVAKENGSWNLLDDAQALIIPEDLESAFENADHLAFFESLSPSRRRNILEWIAMAKRADTRARRIAETVEAASRAAVPGNL